ncbi:MAG: class I SAM-dependent RNA methyltransferase [Lentisphaeraceae bacterium]|nr:class I SAM-dependent RNA methyltransferase [Lentisphaeraceae bacterium]
MDIEVGQQLTVEIVDVAFGGKGVARLDGLVCFVAYTLPGETVKIEITTKKKKFLEADLVEVIKASEDRVEPECSLFGTCGGCQYQHISYEKQLDIKKSQLEQVLARIGGFDDIPVIEKVIPSPSPYHYRNRITLNPRKLEDKYVIYGYRNEKTRELMEIKSCPIASEEVNELIPLVHRTKWAHTNAKRDKPKSATLRNSAGDEPVIFYGMAPNAMPWRKEDIGGKEFRVPLASFYQVNSEVAVDLFNLTSEWINELPVTRVVDAFCGAGFLSAGIKDRDVVGVEENEAAVQAAHYNALQWGAKSSNYIAGDANKLMKRHLKGRGKNTALILDPPRRGCGPQTIAAIQEHKPAWILYVSCDPATLSRDLKQICGEESNYSVEKLAMLDMFPQTTHFETMILLKRGED